MRMLPRFALQVVAGLLFVGLGAGGLAAQNAGSITGTVTEAGTGRAIADVRVLVTGTTLQGVTDADGKYRISNVPVGQRRLEARRIGYKVGERTLAISAGAEAKADFSLGISAVTLEEIVVSGTVGDQTRKAQGATVGDVKVSDLMKVAPVRTIEQALQSTSPGVSVTQASGTSGGYTAIRIRGPASLSLSNDPLIYVDGVRITSSTANLFFTGGQATGRLSELNPQDFESVEIVKGPAAATLYGADASAGVIQIFTKKGRQGSRFTQSYTIDLGKLEPNFTPPTNYAFCTVALARPTSLNPLCRGVDTTTAVGGVTKTLVHDNPLVREAAFRNGSSTDIQWTGRGGGQNFGYYASLNYGNENGTTTNNSFDRRSGRLNFNWTPTPKLSLDAGAGLHLNYFSLPDNDNNVYGYLGGGLLGSPLTRTDDASGNNGWFGSQRDVAAIRAIENQQQTHRTIASATASYVPVPWWTSRMIAGLDWLRDETRRFLPKNARGSYQGLSNTGDISERRQGEERYTLDFVSSVRRNTGPDVTHNVSVGFQILSRRAENIFATGQGLTVNANNVVSAASSKSAGQGFVEQRQVGFLGQYQTSWKDRAFATLGARMDANSSFGDQGEWFFLPKVGLSYVLSEEAFWRDNVPFVNTFRLRGAWGQTGRSPDPGASLTTLAPAPYVLAGASQPGAIPQNPGNDSLRAERGVEIEGGFDAGFLDDRASLEVTYFNKTSKDLLLQRPLPPSLGFTDNPFVNIGELKNKGFEIAVTGQPIQMDQLTWDVRVGFSTLDSKITSMGDSAKGTLVAPFGTLNRFEKGLEPGAFVGLRIRSITENATTCGGVTRATPQPCVLVANNFERIGPVLPTREASISNSITIMKNFRLFGLVDWKGGNYLYNLTDFFRETQLVRSNRRLDTLVLSRYERLRRYGNPTAGQPAFVRENGTSATVNEVRDAYVQPAGFLKLREVSLSYDLPTPYANYLRAQAATITLSGRNLKTWTDYEGFDPELISGATNNFARSDFLTIPQTRQMSVRLNLNF